MIEIKTTNRIIPMIYAYSTPEITRHIGWTKIGYTEQDVDKRLQQQTHTADIQYHEEWRGNAIFEDGSGEIFHDTDFHAYLRKNGIEGQKGTEWFHIDGLHSKSMFYDFKQNHGILLTHSVQPYKLRKEQDDAVCQTLEYFKSHPKGEFLWNAKPRFGKTLTTYDFAKRMNAKKILIVTNRPAIANSWYEDYEKFLGTDSGYAFVSNVEGVKDRKLVVSRKTFIKMFAKGQVRGCIEFVSLQDLKGSIYFGGSIDKLRELSNDRDEFGKRIGYVWDLLVIDEAHEGIDTYKTDVAFEQIDRKFTLHLSGTPFKALANGKFDEDAIFNWTYADEQQAKNDWNSEETNPYQNLPKLNLFTYQMSEIVKEELKQGIEIRGETEEYAFDLNEFFETKNGNFIHDSSVDKFLNTLTTLNKYPFSTKELRNELKHTLWLLARVDSAKILARKLQKHAIFGQYHIILAAGDGKLDDNDSVKKSFIAVTEAIKKYEKTITLSVGQLTTGVTIPQWTAVLMLSNIQSPALYMQAAFRAQNPCLFYEGGKYYRKKNAYVFDFEPSRSLDIFEKFANNLSLDTAQLGGDIDIRKKHIKRLLNFFPVIGEDDEGQMTELNAEKVLSIPRKIRSQEVVRRGFMSNFLFQNISNIFEAPHEVLEIISQFQPEKEPVPVATKEELSIDETGKIHISDEQAVQDAEELFGDKIYDNINSEVAEALSNANDELSNSKNDEYEKI